MVTIHHSPQSKYLAENVTITQRRRCAKEACDVCCFAHEQADDKADAVLLDSYYGR